MCLIEKPSPTAPYSTPEGAGPTLQHTWSGLVSGGLQQKGARKKRGRKVEKEP